jgi:hypothetical protein
MAQPTFQRTFAGGELAPQLATRADLTKYVTGLRTCRNFIILRSGGVANRAGTRFVASTKTNSQLVELHRYVSEVSGESLLIESGPTYLRFFKNGGAVTVSSVPAYSGATQYVIGDLVSDAGVNYYCIEPTLGNAPPNASFWYAMPSNLLELPHPFTNGWHGSQSGNVISMVSKTGGTDPQELIFSSLTSWVIRVVNTAPGIAAPTGLVGTAGGVGTLTYAYKITAGAADSFEESLPSGVASVPTTATPTPAAPIGLVWTPVIGAGEIYVYCDPYGNGTFGFVGTATVDPTTGLPAVFNDAGFPPDFAVTPPLVREPFLAPNYPSAVGNYQQRRFFANIPGDSDAVFGSRVGFINNFNVSSPIQDDDAITFKIAGSQHNPVRWLVGLKRLIVGTDAGIWVVGQPLVPLAPSNLAADQETYAGVSKTLLPVVIGNAILYVQSQGAIIRDVQFEQAVEGLAGRDLTIFASHLFDNYNLIGLDYQQTPHSTVWAIRSDGTLLGMTYLREQDVWGWHRHDTFQGVFEDICVVPEAGEDVLYAIVRRTIGTSTLRYIEKLESRGIINYNADAFFVDSGLSYSGPLATVFSGLGHLAGMKVAVLADGVVKSNGWDASSLVVSAGGTVTIPPPGGGIAGYATVHIGLAIQHAEIETLDLDVGGSDIRDKKKKVQSVTVQVDQTTKLFYAGRDGASLMPYKRNPFETNNQLNEGGLEQNLQTAYTDTGRVFIQVRDPIPMTILGVIPNVTLGG